VATGSVKTSTTGSNTSTTTTTNTFDFWDSAKQSKTTITGGETGSSTFTYDVNGNLSSANITGRLPHSVAYVTDSAGTIYKRQEADNSGVTVNPVNYYYYLSGKRLGDAGNTGSSQVDYATSLNQRRVKDPSVYPNGNIPTGDFGPAYDPININSTMSTGAGQTYVVRDGDNLRAIAQAFWGDASLWYVIASANGLSGSEVLAAGTRLRIPADVVNVHNKSSTFRVYDSSDTLGNLQPIPKGSKGKQPCGGAGQILVALVATVVAFVVAPYAVSLIAGNGLAGAGVLTGVGAIPAAVAGGTLSPSSHSRRRGRRRCWQCCRPGYWGSDGYSGPDRLAQRGHVGHWGRGWRWGWLDNQPLGLRHRDVCGAGRCVQCPDPGDRGHGRPSEEV